MHTNSRSLIVFETICHELLARLAEDTSERARAFIMQANELLAILEGWHDEPPEQEARAGVMARVFDLHRTAMEYVTEKSAGGVRSGSM